MTNDTDTTAANADAANNSESSRAAAVIDPSNGLWERAAAVLRQQVSEAVWFSTFSDIIVERDTPGKVGGTMSLTLRVPNAFVRDRVLTRYMSLVRDALNEAGGSAHELHVDVRQVAANPVQAAPNTPLTAPHTGVPSAPVRAGRGAAVGLNPRYTFDTFVKGASNQFALAAAQRVAETPGRSYKPLFIYGSAGLGKTHLLHAIGSYVHEHYPNYEVRYVSTETFLNEYVDGIRNNTISAFKRRYREVDVLLIDDIQFMEGKEGLQEEFFHTFNSLHGASKQIVISSDRVPDAIPTLEDRLRGRFRWGLITDIQPPDVETRLAILRNKAEREYLEAAPDVLEFIASSVTTNIRELEGALVRVAAYASLNKAQIDVDLARELLVDLVSRRVGKQRSPEQLLTEICDYLGVTVEAVRGRSRQRPIVGARQTAMYVVRELTDLSYPAIARLFGGRDHTTVIHAVEKTQHVMKDRQQVFDQVNELLRMFKT
ncbi:MAG: chromosomal replication initiator protein DnaA [Actinomycetota bacterium]